MSDNNRQPPVEDQPEVFELMLKDMAVGDAKYQPTNYWSKYINKTIEVIRKDGVKEFRNQPQGYFRSFGAADFNSTTEYQKLFLSRSDVSPSDSRVILDFLEFAERNPDLPVLPLNLRRSDLDQLAARTVDLEARANGSKSVTSIAPSLAGNPIHTFEFGGKTLTHFYLDYFMRYSYASRFIDFDKVDNIVELGSGVGNQVEVLKKLFPHITFYLLDLAPYLYVCQQFLKHTFPEYVVDYRETRDIAQVTAAKPGQMLFLGNRRISDIRPKGTTLFWNSASFGEMEPDVVENYLSHIKPWAHGVYLFQAMQGKEIGAEGRGGVIRQTLFADYERFLGPSFKLVDRSPAFQPLRYETSSGGFDDAIWVASGGAMSGDKLLRRR